MAGIIVQYPNTEGHVPNLDRLIRMAKEKKALVVMSCDLLSLTLLRSAGGNYCVYTLLRLFTIAHSQGDIGADVAVGSAGRFGIPLFYGGPHPAFMAVGDQRLARMMPGRIVGVSKDSAGDRWEGSS